MSEKERERDAGLQLHFPMKLAIERTALDVGLDIAAALDMTEEPVRTKEG